MIGGPQLEIAREGAGVFADIGVSNLCYKINARGLFSQQGCSDCSGHFTL